MLKMENTILKHSEACNHWSMIAVLHGIRIRKKWKRSLEQESLCMFDSGRSVPKSPLEADGSPSLSQMWCSPFYHCSFPLHVPKWWKFQLLRWVRKKMHGKVFSSTFIWKFANIFNKVTWKKNNARYISQKLESLFLLCTWGILHAGLWLNHHTVYAGWGTCGIQCEGGKTQSIQVQLLNKQSAKLAWILLALGTPGNRWNVVNADL